MEPRSPVRLPLEITAEWISRFWTTTPTVYTPHRAWSVQMTVSASSPIRVATVEVHPETTTVCKLRGRGLEYSISAGEAIELIAEDAADELPPSTLCPPWTAVRTPRPAAPTTWELVTLARDADHRVETAMIVFPRQDTELLRTGRWRVRQSLQQFLPIDASALYGGAWRGPAVL